MKIYAKPKTKISTQKLGLTTKWTKKEPLNTIKTTQWNIIQIPWQQAYSKLTPSSIKNKQEYFSVHNYVCVTQ